METKAKDAQKPKRPLYAGSVTSQVSYKQNVTSKLPKMPSIGQIQQGFLAGQQRNYPRKWNDQTRTDWKC